MGMDAEVEAALEKKNARALAKALEGKPDLTALDDDGRSALHRAVLLKKLDLAELLLAAGAPIDVKDEMGNTPLYVLLSSKNGSMNDVETANATWLIDRGASLNVPGDAGFTALHFAAPSAKVPFLEMLVARGAKITRDETEATPLHRCVDTDHKDDKVWAFLLARGCSVKDVNDEGWTILHEAVTNHNPAAVKYFLGKGVDRDAKDRKGKTALDYAVKYKNAKIIALLGG